MEVPIAKVSACVMSPMISKYIGHQSAAVYRGAVRRAAARRRNRHAGSRCVRTNAMLGIEFPHCYSSTPYEFEFPGTKPDEIFFSDPAFGK